jgi:hypothetical protein
LVEIRERVCRDGSQARIRQSTLPEAAIVFETVAERAATDHEEAVTAQLILLFAMLRALEQHDAIRARRTNPIELRAVVVDPCEHTVHHTVLSEIATPHPDLVPLRAQTQVHVPEIATVSDTEKAHAPT